jgi:hypothetical protein
MMSVAPPPARLGSPGPWATEGKPPLTQAEAAPVAQARIWKVASWCIPLLDGIYHAAIGKYHMVYTMVYNMIYSMVYTLSFTI